jgi:uncharacterized membrane protein
MNELIENIRANLDAWGELTEVLLNAISLLFIVAGVIHSVVKSIKARRSIPGEHPLHTYFRRMFGGWLIVSLEFQLTADCWNDRFSLFCTFNRAWRHRIDQDIPHYFLNKELKEERGVSNALIEKK